MVFNLPGIYWDIREPPPPAVRRQMELERDVARRQHREPRMFARDIANERLFHGPRFEIQEAEIHLDGEPTVEPGAQPRDDRAEVITNRPDDGFLPPLSASVKAQLIQDTAKVTITQLFANDIAAAIPKASYTFPLPQGCTVTEFLCRLGHDRILRGKIKAKEDALDSFNTATRRDQTAALLNQNTTEIFTTTLGNIPARCRLKVEISFIFLLPYTFDNGEGLTTFTLPLYIAPRFGTPPPSLQEALRSSAKLRSLRIEVDVLAPETIKSISCRTHAIRIEMGVGSRTCQTWQELAESGRREGTRSALITLEQTTQLDRDFVLEIKTEPEDGLEQPQACVERHPDWPHHRAVMLTIPPNLILGNGGSVNNGANGEIVFIADRSGSMEDKMSALKSAMQFFLKGIPRDRHFNVWCFGDRFEHLWPRSQSYSEQALEAALEYVSQEFRSNMGGTELLPALQAVVAARGGYQTMDVITLTDGQVWDLEGTLDFVQKTRKSTGQRVRFFCLGIGAAVSHALIEGIAKLGGGYAEVIPLASEGGWESRIVAVLKAALTDHIGVVDIEIDGQVEVDGHATGIAQPNADGSTNSNYLNPAKKLMRSPAQASTLSPFLHNRVFMLFESLDPLFTTEWIQLEARRPGGERARIRVPIKALSLPGTTIHKLAARALLGDLERRQSHMHLDPDSPLTDSSHEQAMVKKEGERLGCRWSLVSQWTSFVAVEEHFTVTDDNRDPFMDSTELAVQVVPEDGLDLLRPRGAQSNPAFTGLPSRRRNSNPSSEDDETSESAESDSEGPRPNFGTGSRNDDDDDDSGGGHGPSGLGGPTHGANANTDRDSGRRYQGPNQNSQLESGRGHPSVPDTRGGAQYTYGQASQDDTGILASATSLLQSGTLSPQTQHSLAPTAAGSWAQRIIDTVQPQRMADTPATAPFPTFHQARPRAANTKGRVLQPAIPDFLLPDPDYTKPNSSKAKWETQDWLKMAPEKSAHTRPHEPQSSQQGLIVTKPIRRIEADQTSLKKLWSASSQLRSSKFKKNKDSTEATVPTLPPFGPAVPASSISAPEPLIHEPLVSIRGTTFPPRPHNLWAEGNSAPEIDHFPRMETPPISKSSKRVSAGFMSAPRSNLPAASAMMETSSLQAKSPDGKAREAFIRELLVYQLHDGSFSIPDSRVASLLGQTFSSALRPLANLIEVKYEMWGHSEIPRVALAAAILAVFEDQLPSERALWQLMVDKIRGFISGLCWEVGSIINDAKEQLLGIQPVWDVPIVPPAARPSSTAATPLDAGNDALTRAASQAIEPRTRSNIGATFPPRTPGDTKPDLYSSRIFGRHRALSSHVLLDNAPRPTAGDEALRADAHTESGTGNPPPVPGREGLPKIRRATTFFSSVLSQLSKSKPDSETSALSRRARPFSRLRSADPPSPASRAPTVTNLSPPLLSAKRSPVADTTDKATMWVSDIPPPPPLRSTDQ